ncbi:hypothetical protein PRNP1_011276 [Phytophthora ramorum]
MGSILVSVLVYVLAVILRSAGVTALSFNDVDEDPIVTFGIENFQPDDVKKLPVKFRFTMAIRSKDSFRQHYSNADYCVEIDGGVWRECKPLLGYDISFDELEEGSHSAIMYLTEGEGGDRYHETNPVNFSVVADESFDIHCEKRVEQEREVSQFPKDESILQWAERQGQHGAPSTTVNTEDGDVFLPSNKSDVFAVIGIKTAVLTNFPKRQAVRDTWASKASLPPQVKVFFLGCTPNMSAIPSAWDRRRIERAVDLERATYGDLLTEELECEDGYHLLADKVKAYFQFAVAEFSGAEFVVLADDDIYLQVDQLSDYLRERNPQRQYLGEVWRELLKVKEHPLRDPSISNYLPIEQYPMHEYPPYAIGSCYVVSMDSARFIAKNSWQLRSLNGIEDATTALWLLTRQVHYELAPFSSLRIGPCIDSAISMGEFSTLGIRLIAFRLKYASAARKEPYCASDRSTS